MALNIDYEQAFYNGDRFFNVNNLINAKYYLNISVQDPRFRDESLCRLVKIAMKESKFSIARKMLNENVNNNLKLKLIFGNLESVELNFRQSEKYYRECMSSVDLRYISLLKLAELYINMGDYEIARKMLETLRLNPNFFIRSTISLIGLCMLERNFYEAQKIISEFDFSKKENVRKQFLHLDYYIKYFLGELKMSDYSSEPEKSYMIKRLFFPSEDLLLNHIDRHYKKYKDSYFYSHIDTKYLLHSARDKIQNMNGLFWGLTDIYKVTVDYPIGCCGDSITSDLCVTTVIGTKDIITMNPTLLSSEYDKEGFGTSESLRLKRLGGII